jgi:hypothetical protein
MGRTSQPRLARARSNSSTVPQFLKRDLGGEDFVGSFVPWTPRRSLAAAPAVSIEAHQHLVTSSNMIVTYHSMIMILQAVILTSSFSTMMVGKSIFTHILYVSLAAFQWQLQIRSKILL